MGLSLLESGKIVWGHISFSRDHIQSDPANLGNIHISDNDKLLNGFMLAV